MMNSVEAGKLRTIKWQKNKVYEMRSGVLSYQTLWRPGQNGCWIFNLVENSFSLLTVERYAIFRVNVFEYS